MNVHSSIFLRNWATVLKSLAMLVFGELGIMMHLGKPSSLSVIASMRSSLYIAPWWRVCVRCL
jgi:hypothetical protein